MFFQVAYYMYMTGPRYRPTLKVTSNGLNSAFREKKYGYLFDLYPLLFQPEKAMKDDFNGD